MRLEGSDQHACVYKHALQTIGVNALAADGFIAQKRSCASVTFRPLMKPASPFLRVGSLQVRDGCRLRFHMLHGDLLHPSLHRQPMRFRLRLERFHFLVRKLNGEVQTTVYYSTCAPGMTKNEKCASTLTQEAVAFREAHPIHFLRIVVIGEEADAAAVEAADRSRS